MIEMNKVYTYRQVCDELGLPFHTGGNQKVKQREEIGEQYTFDYNRGKFIFLSTVGKPREDKRHNKSSFSHEEFMYLWKFMLSVGNHLDNYYMCNGCIYLTNSLIFDIFGMDFDHRFVEQNEKDESGFAKKIFDSIVYNAVKGATISKICRMLDYNKNSMPKGILYTTTSSSNTYEVGDDALLDDYNEKEKEVLKKHKCADMGKAIDKNLYNTVIGEIQAMYVDTPYFNIRKVNKITITMDMLDDIENFHWETKKVLECKEHFRQSIYESVKNSVENRVTDRDKYKLRLSDKKLGLLQEYYKEFAEREGN